MKENVLTLRGQFHGWNAFIAGQGSRHLTSLHPEHLSQEQEQQGQTRRRCHSRQVHVGIASGSVMCLELHLLLQLKQVPTDTWCRWLLWLAFPIPVTMTVTVLSPYVPSHSFPMGSFRKRPPLP